MLIKNSGARKGWWPGPSSGPRPQASLPPTPTMEKKKITGMAPELETQVLTPTQSANRAGAFGTCSCPMLSSHQRGPRRSHRCVTRFWGPPRNSAVFT